MGAAAGHIGFALLFRNTGSTSCTLTGYPGVAGLSASGEQVTQATRMANAYMGGYQGPPPPPPVTLQGGDTASATVQGTDVPSGNETTCPALAGMLVTPPNTSTSVHISQAPPDCGGLIVTPVVPGTSGSGS
jgi:Protein of unknown function (DUF4232)